MTTCRNSTPHEKPQWKDSQVRCNSTGFSCAYGATHDKCMPGKTPQMMALELR